MENPQKTHYEHLHETYAEHYFDESAVQYRRQFIFSLFPREFRGGVVADLGCGSGGNSAILKEQLPNTETVGFDISEEACRQYSDIGSAVPADFTEDLNLQPEYDAALAIGFLHHCVNDLPQAAKNISDMLKPGGFLFVCEPSARSMLEPLRRVWYRHDPLFEHETERALNYDEIADVLPDFDPVNVTYSGGPAYFLLLNSMVFRLPKSVKNAMSAPLLFSERLWNVIPIPSAHAMFVASWRKR